jgi:hypothetical protein
LTTLYLVINGYYSSGFFNSSGTFMGMHKVNLVFEATQQSQRVLLYHSLPRSPLS